MTLALENICSVCFCSCASNIFIAGRKIINGCNLNKFELLVILLKLSKQLTNIFINVNSSILTK